MEKYSALVVDPSPSMRKYVKTILMDELNFHETHEAKNAGDARQLLKSNRSINWIFSEWELPDIASRDFLGHLRKDHVDAMKRFVMLSGQEDFFARKLAIEQGVADYLCKPFSSLELMRKVQRLEALGERRGAKRFSAGMACEIDIGFDPFSVYAATVADISATGCRVKTSRLNPGSGRIDDIGAITLTPKHAAPFKLDVKIKHVGYNPSADPHNYVTVGLEFIFLEPPQQLMLNGFLHEIIPG